MTPGRVRKPAQSQTFAMFEASWGNSLVTGLLRTEFLPLQHGRCKLENAGGRTQQLHNRNRAYKGRTAATHNIRQALTPGCLAVNARRLCRRP